MALNAALSRKFTYCSKDIFDVGTSVIVPVKTRKSKAVVLEKLTKNPLKENIAIKEILEPTKERPKLPEATMKWAQWLSDYYFFPLGMVLESCFPPLKPATKNRKSNRPDVVPQLQTQAKPKLTEEQVVCIEKLTVISSFKTNLLFGITGSGKTEVYMRVIEETLKKGLAAFVVVPEISLTPQIVNRFSERFPEEVAVIHSQLTPREKTNQWWSVVNGEKKILIGARSALFCPIEKIGLIILDEEHESSFKQDEKLKYHGRDAAIMLARFHDCPIILGSATPSIETWNNVQNNRYQLCEMTKRVENRPLPNIHIVDLKDKDEQTDLPFWLSPELYEAMKIKIEKKEQVALFLNRRGMAQTTLCTDCGYVYECPNCAISLTLHSKNQLHCHYCDYGISLKEKCPSCLEPSIKPIGMGTEQVQLDVKNLFPDSNVQRADRDEIQNRSELEKLIFEMETNQIDILVGTQMIAKGLDFPNLTLVGIVLADIGMNMPDFRSSERAFQLITQVSGRAGRHSKEPGDVFIQTFNPQHLSIQFAKNVDYRTYAQKELEFRAEAQYPPFSRLATFKITGLSEKNVLNTSKLVAQRARSLKENYQEYDKIMILGPAPAPLLKIKNRFRYQVLLKAMDHSVLNAFIKQILSEKKWVPKQVQVNVDIDPLNML